MAHSYKDYFALLDELGKTLEDLTALANQKNTAARKDDVATIDECMKQEQVISLKLRTVEIKRDKMLAELGLTGTKLSGLAAACPPEYRMEAKDTAARLRSRYEIYQSAAQAARTTLEVNLHQIEKALKDQGQTLPDEPGPWADIRA